MTIETERLTSPLGNTEDRILDRTIRPQCLNEYIGQVRIHEQMDIFISAARSRGESLDHLLIFGPPGLGKCITANSYILTERGWTEFATLLPQTFAPDSYVEKHLQVYGLQGLKETSHVYSSGLQNTLKITTSSGFSLEGTGHHPIQVATPQGPQWKMLQEITCDHWVALARNTHLWGSTFLKLGTWPLTLELAYLIGVFVSDGYVDPQGGGHVRSLNAQWISKIKKLLHDVIEIKPHGIYLPPHLMRELELSTLESLPSSILHSPFEIVSACLRGLFELKGRIKPTGEIELILSSSSLVTQIQLLLSNLGIIARQHGKKIRKQLYHRLLITGQDIERCYQYFYIDKQKVNWKKRDPSDYIPYAEELFKAMRDKSPVVLTKFFRKRADFNRLSYLELEKYIKLLENDKTSSRELTALKELYHPNIYWDRVVNIQSGQALVYDFCVPETHSFVANGFYNHNTTLAHITANEMGVNLRQTSGPILEKPGDLAAILTNLEPKDILFIDEIHRLSPVVEEILYPAMEDFQLDIMIGEGPAARSIKLDLHPFTLIGATTRAGLLTSPLRDRFGITHRLEFYTSEELAKIVHRSASILGVPISAAGALELARRARGTPRLANRLLRRVRDYAQVRAQGTISLEVAQKALDLLNVDVYGLDTMDRKLLMAIMEKFEGGPVGVETLAAAISEERGTIEEVIEPFLLQQGFLMRTRRGRVATRLAWQHFGLASPKNQTDLFENE